MLVQSVEPKGWGWYSAIICYYPRNKHDKNVCFVFAASLAIMRRMRCCCKLMTALERRTVTTACTTIKRSYPSHWVYYSKALHYFHLCMLKWAAFMPSLQGALGDGDLMLICIAPDKDGKFGFNVKVGITLRFTTHGSIDSFSHRLCTGHMSLSFTLPQSNF